MLSSLKFNTGIFMSCRIKKERKKIGQQISNLTLKFEIDPINLGGLGVGMCYLSGKRIH